MSANKTRKASKKFNGNAFVKRVLAAMKKKNPAMTMKNVAKRLERFEKSLKEKGTKF